MFAFKKTIVCFLAVIVLVTAFPKNKEIKEKEIPELSKEYTDILPTDMIAEINQVRNNASLKTLQKYDKIDKIILSAPEYVLETLPPPQGFTELPTDIQQKLSNIRRNANISWENKQKQYKKLIKNLPEQFRHLVMPAFGKDCKKNCHDCWMFC